MAAQGGRRRRTGVPAVSAARILEHVKALSADEMEGRAPGTAGERRAVGYLVEQFRKLGLEPGNPDGTYVQHVPILAFTGSSNGVVHGPDADV